VPGDDKPVATHDLPAPLPEVENCCRNATLPGKAMERQRGSKCRKVKREPPEIGDSSYVNDLF